MNLAEANGSDLETSCQRNYGRADVAIQSSLETTGGRIGCTVLELSLEGAQIEADHPLKVDELFWLKLNKMRAFGRVKWTAGNTVGVQFQEKLPKALVLSLLGKDADPKELEDVEAMLAARDWVIGPPVSRPRSLRLADVLGFRDNDAGRSGHPYNDRFSQILTKSRKNVGIRGFSDRRVLTHFALSAVIGSLLGLGSVLLF